MSQTSSTIPAVAMRGVASGVLFMAFFGTLWASIGNVALQGWGAPWPVIVTALAGIGLLVAGISLLRVARRLPNEVAEEDARYGRRTGAWFGIVFAIEGIFIALASVICNALNRFNLFFPIMALIVGIHFFPLAALFHVKLHYIAGALLCLLAIIALLVVPETTIIGSHQITVRSVFLGFGAALILWAVGLRLWLMGRSLVPVAQPPARFPNQP